MKASNKKTRDMSECVRFDWAMKSILRRKKNFCILEGFLSELLRTPIKIDSLLESESNKKSQENKYNRVDVLAKDEKGRYIIIEVQAQHQRDYLERMVFASSKLVSEYVDEGTHYREVAKVISIHIVYFNLGDGDDYIYHGTTNFIGMHNNQQLGLSRSYREELEATSISDIFPQYYILRINNFKGTIKDTFDEWMYFLKHSDVVEKPKAQGLEKAKEVLTYGMLPKSDRHEHDEFVEAWRIEEGCVTLRMEDSYKKGIRDGQELGIKQGHELGIKEGHEQGVAEGIEMAKNQLKAKGYSDEQIKNMLE